MKYLFGLIALIVIAAGLMFAINGNKTSSSTQKTASSSTVLDMSGQGLTAVGSDIYSKTNTTDLILSNNSIKTLPSQMGKMTKVVTFKIDHNILEGSFIGEIRQMSQLMSLDVSYNNMTGMPAEIGQLSKLQTLNYSHNQITNLPNELANLKSNLVEFDLTGNPLSASAIAKLKSELPNTKIVF